MDNISFKAKIAETSYNLSISQSASILDAKNLLSTLSSVDSSCQKWIYKGRILKNEDGINDANIKEGDTIIVMKTASSVSSPSPSSQLPSSSLSSASTPPTTIFHPQSLSPPAAFDNAVITLLDNNSDKTVVLNSLNIINKIIMNIISNPHAEKYRRIPKTNKAFSDKIQNIKGGEEIMLALGFQVVSNDYILNPTSDAWNNLIASKTKLDKFLMKLQQSSSSSSSETPQKVSATELNNDSNDNNDPNNESTLIALQQMLSILALQQNNCNINNENNEKDNNEKDS